MGMWSTTALVVTESIFYSLKGPGIFLTVLGYWENFLLSLVHGVLNVLLFLF